ncbi:ubiquitin-specific protease ubp2 [Arthrobotrys musiformis]|uniref:ubiquitinyl hydrolase 1 n=1 Tax=Arthrobotrys musiformis TaxID=47236 RepID=A0AAV9VXZ1_9PEZI
MLVDNATSTSPPRQGPGKTSPRLFSDILSYNPHNKGINVLSGFPPEDDSVLAQKAYLRSGHSHRFIYKLNQSTPRSYPTETGATHIIAGVCQICRQHVEVRLRYDDNASIASICPTSQNYFHHFRYDHARSGPFILQEKKEETSGEPDVRHFDCTNPGCKTSITITFKSRRITGHFQTLLTDPKVLWNRNKQAFDNHPDVFIDLKAPEGERKPVLKAVPTPAMVLKTMRTVIGGVTARKERRNIPRLNTRFLTQLGDECHEMMEILGFVFDEEQALVPPVLPEEPGNGIPLQDELARIFDDWDLELMILTAQNDIDGSSFQPISAEPDLKKLLNAGNYPTKPMSRRTNNDPTLPEHPVHGILGAQADFSDKLLFWAYERQKECDPENAPFYFDCISDIANNRHSEDLQLQVVTLRSQGEYSRSDVKNAYRDLGITRDFEDEGFIIGNFQSRIADAPRQEVALREALMIIGRSLKNENIMNVSKRVTMNLEQAYSQLGMGVGNEIDTEFISNIFQYQLSENRKDATNLWAALRVIADSRKDHILQSMCDSYDQGLELMDYQSALRCLRVNGQMSDDTIVQYYEAGLPQREERTFKSALRVIADTRQSRALDYYIKTGSKLMFTDGMADWPVGLENTGNTCYLNSLLQYYFTIKPLRDVIMDFDNHEEDEVSEELLQRKQVGGRKVTTGEIERAKKFTHSLKGLFREMVTSNQTYVRPEREISELALNSHNHEVSARKRSVAFADDERPTGFIGPMLPPGTVFEDDEPLPFSMDIDEKPPRLRVTNADDQSSDITLVGENQEPPAYEDQGYIVVDGQPGATGPDENGKGKGKLIDIEESGPVIHAPTPKPGRGISALDEMNLDDDSTVPLLQREVEDESMEDVLPSVPEKDGMRVVPPIPERPPPIPPRPSKEKSAVVSSAVSASQSYEFGRQQDVTECIENVMFQLEAALKGEGVEPDGEQLDIIKTLFYGKTQQTLEFSAPAETRNKEERFANLMIDVGEVGRDIYTAMDGHFDASVVELEGKLARRYLSITALPSILQIQIQRVQFNRATKSSYKSNAPLSFGERIFLDRYMASGDDKGLMARREQSWKWKTELEKLEKRKAQLEEETEGLKLPMALEATKGYLDEINNNLSEDDDDMIVVSSNLLVELEDHKERIGGELRYINDRIKELQGNLNQQFTDLRKYGYRIHSIFMHRGSVNFGHYWIYIYDHHNKIWRNYNDTTVSKAVDEEEIFRGKSKDSGSDGGPYFLVYVREDRLDWMQALCRDLGAGRKSEGVAIDEGKSGQVTMDVSSGVPEMLKGG